MQMLTHSALNVSSKSKSLSKSPTLSRKNLMSSITFECNSCQATAPVKMSVVASVTEGKVLRCKCGSVDLVQSHLRAVGTKMIRRQAVGPKKIVRKEAASYRTGPDGNTPEIYFDWVKGRTDPNMESIDLDFGVFEDGAYAIIGCDPDDDFCTWDVAGISVYPGHSNLLEEGTVSSLEEARSISEQKIREFAQPIIDEVDWSSSSDSGSSSLPWHRSGSVDPEKLVKQTIRKILATNRGLDPIEARRIAEATIAKASE